jgi:DinB superfamily
VRSDIRLRQIRRARRDIDLPDRAQYFVYQRDSYADGFADCDSAFLRNFVFGLHAAREIRAAFLGEIGEIMETKELQAEFGKTFDELINLVSSFSKEKINVKPAENNWSAAQVARHLIKASSGFPQMVSGESEATDRNESGKIDQIRGDLLNFDVSLQSPDFIVPEEQIYEKETLVNSLEAIKSEIAKTIETTDLTKTFKTFEFPVYGYLTGAETLAFVIYHTQRHIYQLKKVAEGVN